MLAIITTSPCCIDMPAACAVGASVLCARHCSDQQVVASTQVKKPQNRRLVCTFTVRHSL
jgi:hypothetical protein